MAPVVYTSSIAVFADDDADPVSGRLTVEATGHPRTHYGVYKQANEGNARVYWLDDGVPSIGLRPMTVYGVGRDQGMTSGPTKAVVAAVLGLPVPGRLRRGDALPVRRGCRPDADRGESAPRARRPRVQPARRGRRRPGARRRHRVGRARVDRADHRSSSATLPFPTEIDHDGIEALGPLPVTPFAEGIAASVAIYRDLAAAGSARSRRPTASSPSAARPRRARAPGRRSGRRRPRSRRIAG